MARRAPVRTVVQLVPGTGYHGVLHAVAWTITGSRGWPEPGQCMHLAICTAWPSAVRADEVGKGFAPDLE